MAVGPGLAHAFNPISMTQPYMAIIDCPKSAFLRLLSVEFVPDTHLPCLSFQADARLPRWHV